MLRVGSGQIRKFDFKVLKAYFQKPNTENVKYVPLSIKMFCLAKGPLNVFFKLPITEISEIDDKKSVSKQ